jgi:hypothetical protein
MDFDSDGNIIGAIPADTLEILKAASRKAQYIDGNEAFCFICSRATDHWGEHSDKQLLEFAEKR